MSDDVEHAMHRSATSAARAALAAASPDATAAVVSSPAVSRLLSPPGLSTPMAPPAVVLPHDAPTPNNPPARIRISLQGASPSTTQPATEAHQVRGGGRAQERVSTRSQPGAAPGVRRSSRPRMQRAQGDPLVACRPCIPAQEGPVMAKCGCARLATLAGSYHNYTFTDRCFGGNIFSPLCVR
jgi:hypothetical protein